MTDSKSSIPSASVPDWSREVPKAFWDPSRKLLRAVRSYQMAQGGGPFSGLRRKYWGAVHRFWSLVTNCEIVIDSQIGGGLMLPHPTGIIIHPNVVIGVNCLIMQQVTIGSLSDTYGLPKIGGHVDIGAGAKILGNITLGDNAKIGANAVVMCDVPAGATAVGVPARIILPKQ
jgi:serine O-acetyltransferase